LVNLINLMALDSVYCKWVRNRLLRYIHTPIM